MSGRLFSSQISIEELVAQILIHRKITYTDQLLLRYVLLSEETLDEQARTLLDRVFYGVRHGLLSLVEQKDFWQI